jgi:predicted phosphodiesterase
MNIFFLADLHFDFWQQECPEKLDSLIPLLEKADALILAGDITNKPKVRWNTAFEWLTHYIDASKIYVIPGNHDFYSHTLDDEQRLQDIAESWGVNWAYRKEFTLDGVRFLCATLWTDFELHGPLRNVKHAIEKGLNDFRYIRLKNRDYSKIKVEDVSSVHQKDLKWILNKLNDTFEGPQVIVTHHAPTERVLVHTGPLNAAYASNLDPLLKAYQDKAKWWFFGHSHEAQSLDIHGWHLKNVSLGYPSKEAIPGDICKAYLYNTQDFKKETST